MRPSPAMGLDFDNWQKLTDEYARALSAMQRGEPGARSRVTRLAKQVLSLSPTSPEAPPRPDEDQAFH